MKHRGRVRPSVLGIPHGYVNDAQLFSSEHAGRMLAELITPEIFTKSQWDDRTRPSIVESSGAARLALGILQQAIADAAAGQRDAREWIASRRIDYVFAFEVICEWLALDCRNIRALVDSMAVPPLAWPSMIARCLAGGEHTVFDLARRIGVRPRTVLRMRDGAVRPSRKMQQRIQAVAGALDASCA